LVRIFVITYLFLCPTYYFFVLLFSFFVDLKSEDYHPAYKDGKKRSEVLTSFFLFTNIFCHVQSKVG